MTVVPAGRPITKADIEAKLAEIGGEVDGQRLTTVVEIRRV